MSRAPPATALQEASQWCTQYPRAEVPSLERGDAPAGLSENTLRCTLTTATMCSKMGWHKYSEWLLPCLCYGLNVYAPRSFIAYRPPWSLGEITEFRWLETPPPFHFRTSGLVRGEEIPLCVRSYEVTVSKLPSASQDEGTHQKPAFLVIFVSEPPGPWEREVPKLCGLLHTVPAICYGSKVASKSSSLMQRYGEV